MSDLYDETATAETDTSREPARDSSFRQPREAAGSADQRHGGYVETSAEVRARIAGQDELPSPAESRTRTWGENPEYYDDNDLASEYDDGDLNASITEDDELPTPQESRARTWGDNPEFYDETDLDSEYDGDLGALTTEVDDPDPGHAQEDPGAEDPDAEPTMAPEDVASGRVLGANGVDDAPDAVSGPDDEPDPAETDLAATGQGVTPEVRDNADSSSPRASGTDIAEPIAGDDGDASSPETDRLQALETEHDAAKQKIADLEAELKAVKEDQATRLDRIEQLLAPTDRQPQAKESPEHGAGRRDSTPAQDASLADRKDTDQGTDTKWAEQARWRRAVSSENVGAAGTLVGAADTVAQFAMHATPEGMAGLGAMVLGLASLGLAKAEKRRKGKE